MGSLPETNHVLDTNGHCDSQTPNGECSKCTCCSELRLARAIQSNLEKNMRQVKEKIINTNQVITMLTDLRLQYENLQKTTQEKNFGVRGSTSLGGSI